MHGREGNKVRTLVFLQLWEAGYKLISTPKNLFKLEDYTGFVFGVTQMRLLFNLSKASLPASRVKPT
jgi:hypothetical protein